MAQKLEHSIYKYLYNNICLKLSEGARMTVIITEKLVNILCASKDTRQVTTLPEDESAL